MPENDIGSTTIADVATYLEDYTVDTETTDATSGEGEYRWQMEHWHEYLGYYKNIPELQTAIDAKTVWMMGAGFEADEVTTMLLDSIKGNGKDSFNTILSNSIRTCIIGGDSFCEIIRDAGGVLANLKPLDPSTIVIVQDKQGRIKHYEQVMKKITLRSFAVEEIFHLSRKRLADEIHGSNVIPLQIHYLDTDDTAKVTAYKLKADQAHADGENLYVPKGTVEVEVIQSQLNQAASPLQWINQLNDYFFQAVNVPQIIIGNAKEFTDASAKIVYLAFEQSVKADQLYIEEQVLYV